MQEWGVWFQLLFFGMLLFVWMNVFFFGGGKGLVNVYYCMIEKLGVYVEYEVFVIYFEVQDDWVVYIDYFVQGEMCWIVFKFVVVVVGGFQVDIDWLVCVWGLVVKNFLICGIFYNCGVILFDLLDQGIEQVGDFM